MRLTNPTPSLNGRALDALQSLFAQTSAVRLNDVRACPDAHASEGNGIEVRIDIYGRSHTLLCAAETASDDAVLRRSLSELRSIADTMTPRATPVIITSSASTAARSLCGEYGAGYLDLDGNARLEVGEFFIVRHSVPPVESQPARPARAFSRQPVAEHAVAAA